jgi:hypothetical protein
MANTKKYISLDKLNKYHNKAVELIDAKDGVVLQTAKDYADSLAENYDVAGSASTAQAAVQANLDAEITRATAAEQANADAIAEVQNEVDALELVVAEKASQAGLDELKDYTGTIPETSNAANIVAYVQEKTAGIATEGSMNELNNRVTQAEADIDAIESDYLKGADKTELTGSIAEALAIAEGAQAHSEGVASDLAEAVEALEGADAGQIARISALEGQIVGLSGTMHFNGVKSSLPENTEGYEQGDVIIIGNKEYESKYKSQKDWAEAMEKNNKVQLEQRKSWMARFKKYEGLDSVDISDDDMKKINDAKIPEGF